MKFAIMGPLLVSEGHDSIPLGSRNLRILLATLLCHAGRSCSADSLIHAIWEDRPPKTAAKNLQVYVYQLRRAVGEGRLPRHPHGYAITVHDGELDADVFNDLIRSAGRAKADGDLPQSRALLARALELSRGPVLADLADVAALRETVTRLTEQQVTALEDRIDIDIALGDHHRVTAELGALLLEHPLRERFYEQQMIALSRCGRQGEALGIYARVRSLLDAELGLQPMESLQRAHLAILRGTDPGPPSAPPAVWNVAARNRSFTGRREVLTQLRDQLTANGSAVVQALHGIGGVGKTQVAIEYAHQNADNYDVVWWIDAERQTLIDEQLAALAVAAGWADKGAELAAALQEVRRRLRKQARWLIIFDNASRPDVVQDWLPAGPGHIVITSRSPGWGLLAAPVPVDVFARAESVALLTLIVPTISPADAERLADALGDLPLALAQAGGVLMETGMPVDDYLHELAAHATEVMSEVIPASYPMSLAAAVKISVARLERHDAAAAQLFRVCAFLAAEPVPTNIFSGSPTHLLPEPLAATARSALSLRRSIGQVGRFGLAQTGVDGPVIHRLTQAIARDLLNPADRQMFQEVAEALVAFACPALGSDAALWPQWEALIAHLFALQPSLTANHHLRHAATLATRYLLVRGSHEAAAQLADELFAQWRDRLGPDHPDTLAAGYHRTVAHQTAGRLFDALAMGEENLARCKRVLGDDHRYSRGNAETVALNLLELGRYRPAKELLEDVHVVSRRLLGDDHLHTLAAAGNLGCALRELGELELARQIHEDTLARKRSVLGEDHLHTLSSAEDLAVDLHRLGQFEAARQLYQEILARSRHVLGEQHKITLALARGLGATLRELGLVKQALCLHQENFALCRRALGEDHPDTLHAAAHLAIDFDLSGQDIAARQLRADTLDRCQRVLGEHHPVALSISRASSPRSSDSATSSKRS